MGFDSTKILGIGEIQASTQLANIGGRILTGIETTKFKIRFLLERER
jgi:hypothetical protein